MFKRKMTPLDQIKIIFGGSWRAYCRNGTPSMVGGSCYLERKADNPRFWSLVEIKDSKGREPPLRTNDLTIWEGVEFLRHRTDEMHAERRRFLESYSFHDGGQYGDCGLPAIERRLCFGKAKVPVTQRKHPTLTECLVGDLENMNKFLPCKLNLVQGGSWLEEKQTGKNTYSMYLLMRNRDGKSWKIIEYATRDGAENQTIEPNLSFLDGVRMLREITDAKRRDLTPENGYFLNDGEVGFENSLPNIERCLGWPCPKL